MKRLILATHNANKVREISQILSNSEVQGEDVRHYIVVRHEHPGTTVLR